MKLLTGTIYEVFRKNFCDFRRKGIPMEKSISETRIVHCPDCGQETSVRVCSNTVVLNFPLYCPHCKKHIMVDIMKFQMARSDADSKNQGNNSNKEK